MTQEGKKFLPIFNNPIKVIKPNVSDFINLGNFKDMN